jgi:hypothetical protein
MPDTTGELDLRAINYEKIVKGFALQEFKMKQVVTESSSSSWQESYYRETASELTGGTGSAVKGVPRLANFPYGEPSWTLVNSYIEKYGMEGVVSAEDEMLDNVDVIARTLLRISRAVAYAVDSQIYTVLLAAVGNTVAVSVGYEWDSATIAQRDPISNILDAKKELAIDNFDPDNGNTYLIVSPKQYRYILSNSKVVSNPSFKTADVVSNGVVGQICGLKIIVFVGVTADSCLVAIAKECGTWKSAAGLTTHVIKDPGIKTTIRAYEMGVCQANAPNALCSITNVEA